MPMSPRLLRPVPTLAGSTTLYFNGAVNDAWTTIGNWWLDAGHTAPAGRLPTSGDSVVSAVTITASGQTVVDFTLSNPNPVADGLLGSLTVTGNATFNDFSYLTATLTGSAVFAGNSTNQGTVNGSATFNSSSSNFGGTVNGNAAFNNSANNQGTVNGDATFSDLAWNGGTVNGNATFNGGSTQFSGTITGNATFNDSSNNQGGAVNGIVTCNTTGTCTPTDTDAAAYLTAVETADTQALEPAVRIAIEAFVVGCKQDNIWSALKAGCILMGARTLAGALVPLRGAAPGNANFVGGDYDRRTGLKGNGFTTTPKVLFSGRNNQDDPQDNQHMGFYQSEPSVDSLTRGIIGVGLGASGSTHYGSGAAIFARSRSGLSAGAGANNAGFFGMSRSSSGSYVTRAAGSNTTQTITSNAPEIGEIWVFNRNHPSSVPTNARLAYYSVGESLDLALLDARVSALYTAIDAAI